MKKKILIIAVSLIAVLSLIAMTNTVEANCTNQNCGGEEECTGCQDGTCDENCCPAKIGEKCYPSLDAALAAANDGDTVVLQRDITITGSAVNEGQTPETGKGYFFAGNNKKFTLDLNSKTLESTNTYGVDAFVVKNGTNITIKNGTIKRGGSNWEVISVTGGATLTLDKCTIEANSNGSNTYGQGGGVRLDDNATVTINNSTVKAKYALWLYGSNGNLTVNNSNVEGWAALDISVDENKTATGNKVAINNSTLTGKGIYSGNSNSYGTVVIGAQKGLDLKIKDSTILSEVTTEGNTNLQDLFLVADSYKASDNINIEVTGNSKLSTDGKNGSTIFHLSGDDNRNATNTLSIGKDVAVTGTVYPTVEGWVYVTIYDRYGNEKIIAVKKDEKVPQDKLAVTDIPNGYIFSGWYKDKEFKTIFNQEEAVTENISLYPKFEKTTTAEDLRTSIRALIAKAEGEENMTEELRNAVAEARAVLEETGSTYGELQEALAKLQKAYDAFKNGTISDNQPNKTPEKDKNLDTTPKTGDYIMEVSALLTIVLFANVIYFVKAKRS